MSAGNDQRPTPIRAAANDVSRFRDYADADADWFWELDPNFRFAIVSRRQDGRSPIRENDLLGKTPWEFADADPNTDPEWAGFLATLERRQAFRDFRIRVQRNGDPAVFWRLSGKPVIDDEGTFYGYRGVATDETVEAIRRTQLQTVAADYQAALEMASEGIAYFDGKHRLAFTSTAFRGLVRLPPATLKLGTPFVNIITALRSTLALGADEAAEVAPTVPTRGPVNWTFTDGRRLIGEVRLLPSGGHAIIVRDAQIGYAAAAAESAGVQRFREMMSSSLQGFLTHVDGQIVYANPAAAQIFGCNLDKFVGSEIWEFIEPAEIPRLQAYGEARIAGEDVPERYQVHCRHSDGSPVEMEFLVRLEEWGGLRAFHIFLQDRTVELHAERALANSERRFRNLIEGSIQGFFVHRDWQILYSNTAAAKIFGFTVDEFVGHDVTRLIAPEELETVSEIHRRRLAGDADVPERYQMWGVRKDGVPVAVEVFSRIVDWIDGPAIQSTLMDITQRKTIEVSLVRAKEAAEHADRAKTDFLGNMSHELRTPLNAIIGFSQLIRDQVMGEVSARYIDYAGAIHSSGMHLLEVVNDLLDVASIESGAMVLSDERLDLGDVARSCERMLRPRAQKAGLLVSMDVPDTPLMMLGDDRRLKQILINLIGNAIKFTERGGRIIVSASCDVNGRIVLSIEDTGIGISEENLKTVFDPFFRVDTAFVSQREGTGLGLPLVRALADMHGAEIGIESSPGVGTKVTLVFPPERTLAQADPED